VQEVRICRCGKLFCLDDVRPPARGEVVWGPHHYYPDTGRILWLHPDDARELRAQKRSAWHEIRGVAFGTAEFSRTHPLLRKIHELLSESDPKGWWLVCIEGSDGGLVHIGSFHADPDKYVLAG
jgi:hypothetical protein